MIHIKTCKMFLESMAYIYSAAVIGKGAELKFPANLLKSDIVAFFNSEKPQSVVLTLRLMIDIIFFVLDHCYLFFQMIFELLVKGETAQGMIKAKDLV